MKIVNLDRGEGKTTAAIKQAHETGAYIIVKSREEAHYTMRMAEELHLNIRFPVTFEEFLNSRMRGSHVRNIIIEDAERLFLSLFNGFEIEMVTLNIKDARANLKK